MGPVVYRPLANKPIHGYFNFFQEDFRPGRPVELSGEFVFEDGQWPPKGHQELFWVGHVEHQEKSYFSQICRVEKRSTFDFYTVAFRNWDGEFPSCFVGQNEQEIADLLRAVAQDQFALGPFADYLEEHEFDHVAVAAIRANLPK